MGLFRLLITAGPDKGRAFELVSGEGLLIGRSRDTATRLTDLKVSRIHCEVAVRGDEVIVSDFDSAGGTFVNGQPIRQQSISIGDVIRVGETEFCLQPIDIADAGTFVPEQTDSLKRIPGTSTCETRVRDFPSVPTHPIPAVAPRHRVLLIGAVLAVVLSLGGAWWWQAQRGSAGVPPIVPPLLEAASSTGSSTGRLVLLSIGISEYNHAQLKLRYAAHDADALVETFRRQPVHRPFSQHHCISLTDARATRQAILRGLVDLTQLSLRDHDVVVVSFSGHGLLDKHEFFFLPVDADPAELATTAIPWHSIRHELSKLPCPTVVILDACHSGATLINRGLKSALDVDRISAGMVVLAGCRSSETAVETRDLGHGALTLAVREAIEGRHLVTTPTTSVPVPAEHGKLSLMDLSTYAIKRVRQLVPGQTVVENSTGELDRQSLVLADRTPSE